MSTPAWTTPADLVTKVRRRWDDGSLLAALAGGANFVGFDLPIRGPRAGEIGDQVEAVRRWLADLERGSRGGQRYELVYGEIGGRAFGRNRVPVRAGLTSYAQAWELLGVGTEAATYERLLDRCGAHPRVREWATERPLQALALAEEWDKLLAAYAWLAEARGSGRYLRQINAPGVDTKFVEGHRGVLSQLLGTGAGVREFTESLGLSTKPDLVRLRCDEGFAGLPAGISETTFRTAELAQVRVQVQSVLIVENEITFLTVPVPADGVVLWGKGYEVGRFGALNWLVGASIRYWGDLDTHGFAILDRLRAHFPHAESILMDRATLLAHHGRWGREPKPTAARLPRLRPEEAALYEDLVTDRFATQLRLEQERIDWDWAAARLDSVRDARLARLDRGRMPDLCAPDPGPSLSDALARIRDEERH